MINQYFHSEAYSGIMGLPLHETAVLLRSFGMAC